MTLFLIIMGSILAYAFIGGISGARHHAIESRRCEQSNHFGSYWCGHTYISIWLIGLAWPLSLPVLLGTKTGSSSKESRDEKRRTREIAEVEHKAELARIERQAAEDLARQLKALEKE